MAIVEYPWQPASATGLGSLPYTDPDEAARVAIGALPEFPHLPELPGRGAGSEMIGRTAALLVDIHVDLQPSGWRVVSRPGRDEVRTTSLLKTDLDALEIEALGYEGPLKVQVAGPLTLAAGLERSRGDRMLADHGARRELAESLAEGVSQHLSEVSRRVPDADVVLQLDEPGAPAVLAGRVPTISGFGRLRSVFAHEAETMIGLVVRAAADAGSATVAHCCAKSAPVSVFHGAAVTAVSLDPTMLDADVLLSLSEAVEDGIAVWPGVVPALPPAIRPSDRHLADQVARLWRRLDQDPAAMTARTVVTPACGLAGADVAWAREAYKLAMSTAGAFADLAVSEN